MKNIFKFLKKNSHTIVGIIIVIFVIILGIVVKNFFFPDDVEAYYGTRLEGIEKIKISDKKKEELKEHFKDSSKSLTIRIQGRIIYVDVKLNDVIVTDPDLNITLQEVGKLDDGRRYIKINTENNDAKKVSFKLATTLIPNALNLGSTVSVELYGYNPNCHNYINKTKDIYDINTNNDTNEKVGYATVLLNLSAPNEVITTSSLIEYNNKNSVSVAPMIAEVNPVEDDPEATVKVGIVNNSEYTAKNVRNVNTI